MPPPDLVGLFAAPLNQVGLDYCITGAVAAVVYGEPRLTRDLDVVLDIRPGQAGRLIGSFPAEAFYAPPPETVEEEARRAAGGHFNIIHHATALKVDCYVAGDDPLHAWALHRRARTTVGTVPVWIAPMEYVIIRKLEWHRDGGGSRHLDDIRAMLRVSGDHLQRASLEEWVRRLGLDGQWEAIGP